MTTYTQEQIERHFGWAVEEYNVGNKKKGKGHTGCKDVLQFLLDKNANGEKMWWWSWEFIGRGTTTGGYLSHRAPARASDLALHYGLLEDRKVGRFKIYRLRTEKLDEIKAFMAR